MKLHSMVALALTAGGLTLASPAESRADHRPSVGFSIGVGNINFSYGRGCDLYPSYASPSYYPSYASPSYAYPSSSYYPRTYVAPSYSRYYDSCDYGYVTPRAVYGGSYLLTPPRHGHSHHHHHHHHRR